MTGTHWSTQMVKLLALLLALACTGCSKLQSFSHPTPADLIEHSWWFNDRHVTVCGVVKQAHDSCTLEACMDGSATCAKPIGIWLSAKECPVADSYGRGDAIVRGVFLDLRDVPKEPGLLDYVLARADVTIVPECAATGLAAPVSEGVDGSG